MQSSNLLADTVLEVSDFVALVNQTFEYAYPVVTIRGELANFKISKNRWVYFDLKDAAATVRFFGTVYALPGPLEDGMRMRVRGAPRLHPHYGFSVTAQQISPEGEGTIRRAAELLARQLQAEGLFDAARKRPLLYPPARIGLITSTESAAYADFMKILRARWPGVVIDCFDVQVQGEAAPAQLVAAIEQANRLPELPDVLVLTRGGGSPEDLYAFNTESVTRAVAASRIPTLVAIGHEVDTSLAELAADRRASTPSNAAELLVPDSGAVRRQLAAAAQRLQESALASVRIEKRLLAQRGTALEHAALAAVVSARARLATAAQLLDALSPQAVVARGYAIVRSGHEIVRCRGQVHSGQAVTVEVGDGTFDATVQ